MLLAICGFACACGATALALRRYLAGALCFFAGAIAAIGELVQVRFL